MVRRGKSVASTAEKIGLSKQQIYRWLKQADNNGGRLKEPMLGRPPVLKDDQIRDLKRLLKKPPTAFGYQSAKWKLRLICDLINTYFSVSTSVSSVSRMLREHNISYKRPELTPFNIRTNSTKDDEADKQDQPPVATPLKSAWSFITLLISREAAADGYTPGTLEEKFKVGDGTGRLWKSWQSGKRLARQENREFIIEESFNHGWLRFDTNQDQNHIKLAAIIPSEILQKALGPQSDLNEEELVPPPQEFLQKSQRSARIFAGMLLNYLTDKRELGSLDHQIERIRKSAMTATDPIIRERDMERLNEMLAWRKCVTYIRYQFRANSDFGLIRVKLVAAYRRIGYE